MPNTIPLHLYAHLARNSDGQVVQGFTITREVAGGPAYAVQIDCKGALSFLRGPDPVTFAEFAKTRIGDRVVTAAYAVRWPLVQLSGMYDVTAVSQSSAYKVLYFDIQRNVEGL